MALGRFGFQFDVFFVLGTPPDLSSPTLSWEPKQILGDFLFGCQLTKSRRVSRLIASKWATECEPIQLQRSLDG